MPAKMIPKTKLTAESFSKCLTNYDWKIVTLSKDHIEATRSRVTLTVDFYGKEVHMTMWKGCSIRVRMTSIKKSAMRLNTGKWLIALDQIAKGLAS